MAATRILLVADERNLSELLVHTLLSAGFAVDLAATVAEAGSAIRIAPRNHLSELPAEALWRNRNCDPNIQVRVGTAGNVSPCSHGAIHSTAFCPVSGTTISFVEIAARDFDITVVRQLPATDLPFSDAFEPSAVQM
jgi:hypothetical protein